MEEDEIYDDCQTPVSPSGLSALKSRFENPSLATTKPFVGLKPMSANIAAKFGGSVSTGFKSTSSVTGQDKLKSANKPETVTSKSEENGTNKPDIAGKPSVAKRNSKVNIPAAFQSATDPPPPFDKPKPTVKPTVPTWKQKHDDSNNNKETVMNSNVSKHSAEEPPKMFDKEPKENGLPKTPLGIPTGNVKERANALFGGASPMDLKSALKPVSAKKPDISGKPEGSPKPLSPKRVGYTPNPSNVELREKFGAAQIKSKRKSVKSIVRSKDNRKFHKVQVEDIKSETPQPSKPEKLGTEIDWDKLATDFKKLLTELESSEGASGFEEFEEEEEYDDIGNVRRDTRAISIIQPLTEEEEQEWAANGFKGQTDSDNSLPPPPAGKNNKNPKANQEWLEPEEYDDVGIVLPNGAGEDNEELYEPLPDEPLNATPPPLQPKPETNETPGKPPVPPPVDHIEKKDPKELEKERKRKEKEEKELQKKKEKEFKKKQEDLKNLMSKYKIDSKGLTMSVGKGTILKSAKASKKDIAVEIGDKVDIIRMVDNDKGKWLIRILDTDKDDKHSRKRKTRRTGHPHSMSENFNPLDLIGYVDATNVEVDTNIIRNVMEGGNVKQKFSSTSSVASSASVSDGDEEGETYEAVDGENLPEPIEEEIYEVCN